MSDIITIYKLDHEGQEVWHYRGQLAERTPTRITIEATFQRDDKDVGFVVFEKGDRLIEHFYSDHWYNVFELHSGSSGRLKGWYCNLARPADLGVDSVRQEDLALDLWVEADGSFTVLDEDEFEELPISDKERAQVLAALEELKERARTRQAPFNGSR